MTMASNEIVQWTYDFIQNYYLNNTETLSDTEKIYLNYLSPFSEKYFGPTNPTLLLGGADVGRLLKKELWTFRDGLIPLSLFFAEKSPFDKGTKIMIHKDLWFIVPEKWRNNVEFFEVEASRAYSEKNPPKRIIIMGTPNATLADPEEFVEEVEHLAKTLGKSAIDKAEIIGFFPNKRTDLWGRWQDENIFGYSKALFKNLKIDISFPEWQQLKSEMNLNETLYYEINRGHFIKDTFPLHLFLSRGAGLLEKTKQKEPLIEIKKLKLSLYHNLTVYKLDEENCGKYIDPLSDDLLPYIKRIIEKGTNPRTISAGWEKWFGTYIKKYYQSREIL